MARAQSMSSHLVEDLVPETVEVGTPYGVIRSFAGDQITDELIRFGAHQRSDLRMALAQVQPGDTVFDIGAHVGTFTIPFARSVGDSGRVIAFEPLSVSFEVLASNVMANGLKNVTAVQALIGHDTSSTRRPISVPRNIGATQWKVSDEGSGFAMPVIALDEWWADHRQGQRVALIKVDVEGMEMDVLASCDSIVAAHQPRLVIEIFPASLRRAGSSVSELQEFLDDHRYDVFVNVEPRATHANEYRLGALRNLRDLAFGLGQFRLVDILAVPRCAVRPEALSPTRTRMQLLKVGLPHFPRDAWCALRRRM